ncbi:MAG: NUDIX domain-containing protein [Armatimonadetes bacterium]|nr:MAG: NUDIX domain-containing protein [Armatimonadota bacterium]
MHPVQKHILYNLITNPDLPYSKIKPKEVEGNLFMYHLKLLINEGLIQKRPDGRYELTPKGQIFAENLSLESFKPRIQPKIVTLIACQNSKGEFLLYKRKRQPYLGLIGFPYGKIHLGETVLQAATRELEEKTGLSAQLSHRGDVYLTSFYQTSLLSQTFCHIFFAINPAGELLTDSPIGQCFWESIKKIDKNNFIPGFADIYYLITKNTRKFFFDEFTYYL